MLLWDECADKVKLSAKCFLILQSFLCSSISGGEEGR